MNSAVSKPVDDDEDAVELAALTEAVAKARANRRGVPHDQMRAWLLEMADGKFDTPAPAVRDL